MELIDFGEPFLKLFNQGTLIKDHMKISKSRGNVVNPDDYVASLGADTVRAYLMFLGPWEQGGDWSDSGISGANRWFNRIWNLALDEYRQSGSNGNQSKTENDLTRIMHQTIKKVTDDIDRIRFNTMLAALMEYTNYLQKTKEEGVVSAAAWQEAINTQLLLLAPTAPHLTEELWQKTGREYSIHNQAWPKWDEALAAEEEITLVVQVNGKLRDKLVVPISIAEDEARKLAGESPKVQSYIDGKETVKVIYVPGKLVNIVVR
jgi:leucyl-tRNA synthetase